MKKIFSKLITVKGITILSLVLTVIVSSIVGTYAWFRDKQSVKGNTLETSTLNVSVTGYNEEFYTAYSANQSADFSAYIIKEYGYSLRLDSSNNLLISKENSDTWTSVGTISDITISDPTFRFNTVTGNIEYYNSTSSTPTWVSTGITIENALLVANIPTNEYSYSKYNFKDSFDEVNNNPNTLLVHDKLYKNFNNGDGYTKYFIIENKESFDVKAYVNFDYKNTSESLIEYRIDRLASLDTWVSADSTDAFRPLNTLDSNIIYNTIRKNSKEIYRIVYRIISTSASDSIDNYLNISMNVNLGNNLEDEFNLQDISNNAYMVYTTAELKNAISGSASQTLYRGQTIRLGNNITYSGDLIINKRVNLDLGNYSLEVKGNLVFEFYSDKDYELNSSGLGSLTVSGDIKFLTPYSSCTIVGTGTKNDIYVGGEIISSIMDKDGESQDTTGLIVDKAQIVTVADEAVRANFSLMNNGKIVVLAGTTIGEINTTGDYVTNLTVLNYGTIAGIDFSDVVLSKGLIGTRLYDKTTRLLLSNNKEGFNTKGYSIEIINNRNIVNSFDIEDNEVVSGDTYGVLLPDDANNINTRIEKGKSSNSFDVKETLYYGSLDVIQQADSSSVERLYSTGYTYAYKVTIGREGTFTKTLEDLLDDWFNNSSLNISSEIKANIEYLEILSLNNIRLDETDFSFLRGLANLYYLDMEEAEVESEGEEGIIPVGAMINKTSLKTVILPLNLSRIEEDAFKGCTNLKTIEIPNKVTTIGDDAFNTVKAVYMLDNPKPYSTSFLGGFSDDAVFLVKENNIETYRTEYARYSSVKASRVFRESYTTDFISYYYYSDGAMELSVYLGDLTNASFDSIFTTPQKTSGELNSFPATDYYNQEVKYIGPYCFTCVDNSTGNNVFINLPDSVEIIRRYAFSSTTHLYGIDINKTKTLDEKAFYNCTGLRTVILSRTSGAEIGISCFSGCENLSNVEFNNTETIQSNAFEGCDSLEYLNMPSVKQINGHVFENDKNIKIVIMPNIEQVGIYAFSGCTNILVFDFANSTRSTIPVFNENMNANFNNHVRYLVANMDNIYKDEIMSLVNEKYTGIYTYFKDTLEMDSSDDSTYIPYNVTYFNTSYENFSSSQTSLNIVTSTSATCTKKYPSYNVYTDSDNKKHIISYAHLEFTNSVDNLNNVTPSTLTIPSAYEYIDEYAFSKFIYDSVHPFTLNLNNVKVVGDNAFEDNNSIVSVDAKGVTQIGSSAFDSCEKLGKIELVNIQSIGSRAFYECINLRTVSFIGATSSPTFGDDWHKITGTSYARYYISDDDTIANDFDSKIGSSYKKRIYSVSSDSFMAGLSEYTYEYTTNSITYTVKTNVYTGEYIVDYVDDGTSQYLKITSCNIETLINVIENNKYCATTFNVPKNFKNYTIDFITSGTHQITASDINSESTTLNVKVIGEYAFANIILRNASSVSLIIPDSVETIEDGAFMGLMFSIVELNKVKTIESNAFNGCTNVIRYLSNGLIETIGDYAFKGNTKLIEMDLRSVKTIGVEAFNGSSSLVRVTLRDITSIGNKAFYGCSSLEDLDLSLVEDLNDLAIGSEIISISANVRIFVPNGELTEYLYAIGGNNQDKYKEHVFNKGYLFIDTANSNQYKVRNVYYRNESGDFILSYDKYNLVDGSYVVSASGSYVKTTTNEYLLLVDSLGNEDSTGEYVTVYTYDKDGNIIQSVENIKYYVNMYKTYSTGVMEYIIIPYTNGSDNGYEIETCIGDKYTDLNFVDSAYEVNIPDEYTHGNVTLSIYFTGDYSFANTTGGVNENGLSVTPNLRMKNNFEIIGIGSFEKGSFNRVYLNNVKEVSDYAFYYCTSTDYIDFGSVTLISNYAFSHNTSLTEVYNISNVVEIKAHAFEACTSLASIGGYDNTHTKSYGFDSLTTIGDYAFNGCTALVTLVHGKYNEYDPVQEKQTLIGGVSTIGAYAFNGCTSLENHRFIENNGVVIIVGFDFRSVEVLDNYSFRNCTSLGDLYFEKLKEPGERTFEGCTGVKFVDFTNNKRNGTDYMTPIFTSDANNWFGANNVKQVRYFVPYESYYTYSAYLTNVFYRDGYITVVDNGNTINYSYRFLTYDGIDGVEITCYDGVINTDVYNVPETLTINSIDYTVLSIGPSSYVSVDVTSDSGYTKVIIPTSVKEIQRYAFSGLKMNYIDTGGARNIYEYAFYDCDYLVYFKANYLRKGVILFYSCDSLKIVDFSENKNESGVYEAPDSIEYTNPEYNSIYPKINVLIQVRGDATVEAYESISILASRLIVIDDNTEIFAKETLYNCEYPTVMATSTTITDSKGSVKNGLKLVLYNESGTLTENNSMYLYNLPRTGADLLIDGNLITEDDIVNSSYLTENIIVIGRSAYTVGKVKATGHSAADITLYINKEIIVIEKYAFSESTNIKYLLIEPEVINNTTSYNLSKMESYSFSGCVQIEKSVSISNNVCTLLDYLDLSGISSIGAGVFKSCQNIRYIYWPDLITVGSSTFEGCTSLVGAYNSLSDFNNVKNSLNPQHFIDFTGFTSLGSAAFKNDKNITYINLGTLTSIPNDCFNGCSGLTSSIDYVVLNNVGSWTIEDSINFKNVKTVGSSAFNGCTAITSINTKSITNLGGRAFYGCTALVTVTFMYIDRIGVNCFSECDSLVTLDFSNNKGTNDLYKAPSYIGYFERPSKCYIYVPKNEDKVLSNYISVFGESNEPYIYELGTTYIKTVNGYDVEFMYKTLDSGSVEILRCLVPNELRNDTSVMSELVPSTLNGKTVVGIGRFAYYQTRVYNDISYEYNYFEVDSLDIPTNVTYIEKGAFEYMHIKAINFNNVTSIGDEAFKYNTTLLTLDLDKVETIGDEAFEGANSLTNINLSQYIESIGDFAFYGCNKLTRVYVDKYVQSEKKAPTLGKFAFGYGTSSKSEYSWNNLLEKYKTRNSIDVSYIDPLYLSYDFQIETLVSSAKGLKNASGWNLYYNAISYSGVRYYPDESITTEYYIVEIVHVDSTTDEVRILSYEGKAEHLTIISTATINNVTYSVTMIGENAFQNSATLKDITIPSSIRIISTKAFIGNETLKRIFVDSSNSYYSSKNGVLYNKNYTTLIKYPSKYEGNYYQTLLSTTSVADNAFYGCSNLEVVTLTSLITDLGANIFTDCLNLVQVNFLSDTPPRMVNTSLFPIENDGFNIVIKNDNTILNSYLSSKEFKFYEPYIVKGYNYYLNSPKLSSDEGFNYFENITSLAIIGAKMIEIDVPWKYGYQGVWVYDSQSGTAEYSFPTSIITNQSDLGILASATNTAYARYTINNYKIYYLVGSFASISNYNYSYYRSFEVGVDLYNNNGTENENFETYNITYSGTYTLETPYRPGYKFEYWADENNNPITSFDYANGPDYGDRVFKAVYSALSYTPDFDYNISSVNFGTVYLISNASTLTEIKPDTDYTLPIPRLFGHTFTGYKLQVKSGDTVVHEFDLTLSGGKYSLSKNDILTYLKWEEDNGYVDSTYTIYIYGTFEKTTYSIRYFNDSNDESASLTEPYIYKYFVYDGFVTDATGSTYVLVDGNKVTRYQLPTTMVRPSQIINVSGVDRNLSDFYTFDGWYLVNNNTQISYLDVVTLTEYTTNYQTNTITIKANYEETLFEISYTVYAYDNPEDNDATNIGIASSKANNYSRTISETYKMSEVFSTSGKTLNAFSQAGFTFYGWYKNLSSGYIYYDGSTYTNLTTGIFSNLETDNKIPQVWPDDDGAGGYDADLYYYAYLLPIEYTITYVFDNDTYNRVTTDLTQATLNADNSYSLLSSYTILSNTISLMNINVIDGYEFVGFYTNNLHSGTPVTEIESGSSGAKRYYCYISTKQYKIKYTPAYKDANGKNLGATQIVIINTNNPNPTYFTVDDIMIVVNGNTVSLGTVMTKANLTTYGSVQGIISHFGGRLDLEDPTSTGYTFMGFYLSRSGTDQYDPTVIDLTGNTTIYMRFNEITYTVNYYDGSTLLTAKALTPKTYNVRLVETSLVSYAKSYYTFDGWYDNQGFTGEPITSISGADCTNYDLYAKYTPIEYYIYYKANGELIDTKTYTVETLKTTRFDSDLLKPTKRGYNVTINNSSLVTLENLAYNNGKFVGGNYDVEVTSVIAAFTITYSYGDNLSLISTTLPSPITNLTIDDTINLETAITPVNGYKFLGWYKLGDESNVYTSTINAGVFDSDTTIVAKIEPITINVHYYFYKVDLNNNFTYLSSGVSNSNDTTRLYTDGATDELGVASYTGYEFIGWYYDSSIDYSNLGSNHPSMTDQYKIIYYPTLSSSEVENQDIDICVFGYFRLKIYNINYYYIDRDGVEHEIASTDIIASDSSTVPVTFDKEHVYDLTKYSYARTGYTYNYWTSNNNQISSTNNVVNDLKLYAKYTPYQYTIHFVLNAPNGSTPKVSSMNNAYYTYDTPRNLPTVLFKIIGYSFDGWATSSTGSKVYEDAELVDNVGSTDITQYADTNKDIYLYALYTEKNYTITYDDNNDNLYGTPTPTGTVNSVTDNFNDLVNYVISSTHYDLTGHGYIFSGWGIASNSTTLISDTATLYQVIYDIADTDITNDNESRTIYAIWTPITYKVKYEGIKPSGATGKVEGSMTTSTGFKYGESTELSANAYSLDGYTFKEWNTKSDGTGTQITKAADDKYYVIDLTTTNGDEVTIYTIWEKNTYTINFNKNIPSDATDKTSQSMSSMTNLEYDTNYSLTDNAFTIIGWEFLGWDTDDKATTATYINQASVNNLTTTLNGEVTLYAIWKANEYKVTFVISSPTSTNHTTEVTVKYDYDMPAITLPTKTGYTFKGYYYNTDIASNYYYDENGASLKKWDILSGASLNAHFDNNHYTITFNTNGASYSENEYDYRGTLSLDVTYDEAIDDINRPKKYGYVFAGYYTSDNTKYFDANGDAVVSLYQIADDLDLYASWTKRTYTISYDKNESAISPQTASGTLPDSSYQSYTYENTTLLVPSNALESDGYHTLGWHFDDDSKTGFASTATMKSLIDSIAINDSTIENSNITLYSIYEGNTYYVEFVARKPNKTTNDKIEGTMGNQTFVYGTPQALSENKYSLKGWTFYGWTDDINEYTTYDYIDKAEVDKLSTTAGGTVKLYSMWTETTYTITILNNKPTKSTNALNRETYVSGSINYEDSYVIGQSPYTMEGWTVTGYNTQADGNGTAYTFTSSVSRLRDTAGTYTIYAIWSENTYNITFNYNKPSIASNTPTGSTGSVTSTLYEGPTTLTTNGFSLKGWHFDGWALTSTGAVAYTDGASVNKLISVSGATIDPNNDDTVILYAHWTRNTITFKFDKNTGSGTDMSDMSILYDSSNSEEKLTKNTYTKTGYKFLGWNTDKTLTTALYIDEYDVRNVYYGKDETVQLYAIWQAVTYTVTLDQTGATTQGDITCTPTYDSVMPDLKKTPTRDGYTFLGFFDQATGGTQYYTASGKAYNSKTWDKASDTTLYAHWQGITYTVTFSRTDATPNYLGTLSISQTYGEDMSEINAPKRVGYDFIGYTANADGSGTNYYVLKSGSKDKAVSNNEWDINSDTTLYAQWKERSYTIKYDRNGDSEGKLHGETINITNLPANSTYKYNGTSNTTISTNILTVTGHTQIGWNTDKTLTTASSYTLYKDIIDHYTVSEIIDKDEITFYAIYREHEYTITFNVYTPGLASSNVVVTGDNTQTNVLFHSEVSLDPCSFTLTGWTLVGWSTTSGGAKAYDVTGKVSKLSSGDNGNADLYTVWEQNTITYEFYANGGAGTAMSNLVVTYDCSASSVKLTKNTYTKTGYSFDGWSLKSDASTNDFADEAEVRNHYTSGTYKLYARWKANEYTVTLDQTNTTTPSDPTSFKIDYDERLSALVSIPVRNGYTFNGFFDSSNKQYYLDNGNPVADSGSSSSYIKWDKDSDTTLYAHWTKKTYSITLTSNATTGYEGTKTTTATFDTAMQTITPPKKVGYNFLGYYINDGTNDVYYYNADGTSAKNWDLYSQTSYTLTAKWEERTYTIKYDKNAESDGKLHGETINGSVPADTTYKYNGSTNTTISGNTLTVTGHDQNGWNYDKTATTKVAYTLYKDIIDHYTVSEIIDKTEITFYAVYDEYTYNVKFNISKPTKVTDREVSGTENTQTGILYHKSTALTPNTFTLTGWTLIGWSETQNATTATYPVTGPVVKAKTVNGDTLQLYTVWSEKTYRVRIDSNLGSFKRCTSTVNPTTVTSTNINYDDNYTIPNNPFSTVYGWTLVNYTFNADGSGAAYTEGQSVKQLLDAASYDDDKDVYTIYCQWQETKYNITFDSNEPSDASEDVSGTTDSITDTLYEGPTSLTANGYSLKGWHFDGWALTATGAVAYSNNAEVKKLISVSGATVDPSTSTVTLYAHWTQNTITFKFNNNTGSGTMTDMSILYDDSSKHAYLTANTFTKTGYTFTIWNTKADGNGTSYNDGQDVYNVYYGDNQVVTLYAQWSANTYAVSLDQTGVNKQSNPTSVTATYDSKLTDLTSIPEKNGYTFNGFYTATSGGVQYYDKDGKGSRNWDFAEAKTLYPQWSANTYTVALNDNGNHSSYPGQGTVAVVYNTTMTTLSTLPKRIGYDFAGYYTEAENGTQYYNASGVGLVTSTIYNNTTTLYAHWTLRDYTVVFDNNSSKIRFSQTITPTSIANDSFTYLDTDTISTSTFSTAGYTFKGWHYTASSTEALENTTTYTSIVDALGVTHINDTSITLYAVWDANDYTITLTQNDADDLSNAQTSISVEYGETVAKVTSLPFRTGYTFSGYYSAATDGTQYIDQNGNYVKSTYYDETADRTLYIHWTPITYIIRFHANNGTDDTVDQIVTYDVETSLMTNTFSKTGYTFNNTWNTNSDMTGNYYPAANKVKNLRQIVNAVFDLYASWSANKTVITFDNCGATTPGTSKKAAFYDSAMPSITCPSKTGYDFGGYYVGQNGTGKKYYNSDGTSANNWAETDVDTLYAYWIAHTYVVVFNVNTPEGSVSNGTAMSNQSFSYGETKNLTANTLSVVGYTFLGWNTDDDATTVLYTNGQSVNNLSDVDEDTVNLYAIWSAKTYTVSYNTNSDKLEFTQTITETPSLPSSYSYVFGTSADTLTTSVLSTQGYTFVGWSYKENGTSSDKIDDNEEIRVILNTRGTTSANDTTSLVLYAIWTANPYSIEFDNDGATTPGSTSTTATYGETMPDITYPTKIGYIFKGYYITIDSEDEFYYPASGSSTVKLNIVYATGENTITLTASWEAIKYDVQFNSNKPSKASSGIGGTAMSDLSDKAYGASFNLPENTFTLTGWTFLGWSEDPSATEETYIDKALVSDLSYTDNDTVILYAIWEQTDITIEITYGYEITYGTSILNNQYSFDRHFSDEFFANHVIVTKDGVAITATLSNNGLTGTYSVKYDDTIVIKFTSVLGYVFESNDISIALNSSITTSTEYSYSVNKITADINANVSYYVLAYEITYNVILNSTEGELLPYDSEWVAYGETGNALQSSMSAFEQYTYNNRTYRFNGWENTNYINVTSDHEINATYTEVLE